jgi:hypothetical protein
VLLGFYTNIDLAETDFGLDIKCVLGNESYALSTTSSGFIYTICGIYIVNRYLHLAWCGWGFKNAKELDEKYLHIYQR